MASLGASYGSMRVGDKVMAKIYDTAAGLVPGDMGVVECVAPPSPDGLHFVRFVSLMPTRNLLALHSWQLEDETTYLSRQGVSKGQTVYSTISWKSGLVNVVPGSPGTVMGAPDSNNNGEGDTVRTTTIKAMATSRTTTPTTTTTAILTTTTKAIATSQTTANRRCRRRQVKKMQT